MKSSAMACSERMWPIWPPCPWASWRSMCRCWLWAWAMFLGLQILGAAILPKVLGAFHRRAKPPVEHFAYSWGLDGLGGSAVWPEVPRFGCLHPKKLFPLGSMVNLQYFCGSCLMYFFLKNKYPSLATYLQFIFRQGPQPLPRACTCAWDFWRVAPDGNQQPLDDHPQGIASASPSPSWPCPFGFAGMRPCEPRRGLRRPNQTVFVGWFRTEKSRNIFWEVKNPPW